MEDSPQEVNHYVSSAAVDVLGNDSIIKGCCSKDTLFVTSEFYKRTTRTSGVGKTQLTECDLVLSYCARWDYDCFEIMALLALYYFLQVIFT
ncbi:uncharacterized protein ARMOST_04155 [Armillaria ostoyae]|uniref:Uncharacterized protein n=1 Tax=Armillaria ostoyae TaxID=47428 RepID=A0A284QWL9_ARMOS|nr:uncharacterized protein ARMOST_04155 [Armillaria ostoyae]